MLFQILRMSDHLCCHFCLLCSALLDLFFIFLCMALLHLNDKHSGHSCHDHKYHLHDHYLIGHLARKTQLKYHKKTRLVSTANTALSLITFVS